MRNIIALFFVAVFVVACSSPATESTQTAGDEPTLREALEDAGVEIDPVLREFMLLEEKRATQQYTVAYDVTMSFEGESQEYAFAEFHAAEDKVRKDTTIPDLMESRTYEMGDSYVTCNNMGSWQCQIMYLTDTEVEISYEEETVDTQVYETEEIEEGTFERDGEEIIAGHKAKCYKTTMAGFVGRECRSEAGVMLLTEGVDAQGGTIAIRATNYKESVSQADFSYPAEPVESGSAAAQEASCRDACVMLEMSDSECDDFCAQTIYE